MRPRRHLTYTRQGEHERRRRSCSAQAAATVATGNSRDVFLVHQSMSVYTCINLTSYFNKPIDLVFLVFVVSYSLILFVFIYKNN